MYTNIEKVGIKLQPCLTHLFSLWYFLCAIPLWYFLSNYNDLIFVNFPNFSSAPEFNTNFLNNLKNHIPHYFVENILHVYENDEGEQEARLFAVSFLIDLMVISKTGDLQLIHCRDWRCNELCKFQGINLIISICSSRVLYKSTAIKIIYDQVRNQQITVATS